MIRIALRHARLFPLFAAVLLVSCFSAQANDSVPVAAPGTAGGGLGGGGAAIPPPGLEELVNQADLIVVGRVDNLNSYWNPEHSHIFTNVGVSVERVVKGTPGGDVVVRAPGGTAEGITEWLSEAPSFAVGERALLFLKSEDQGVHSLASLRWGKQMVEDDRVLPMNLAVSQVISSVDEILRKQGLPTPGGNLVEEEASFTLPMPLNGTLAPISPPAATSPAAAAGWQDIMTENFEGTFPGSKWALGGNPTWGKDDYEPYTGTYSGWCARGGTLGQDPEYYYYPNNMTAWMVYGPFSLSGATDAELNFHFWLQSQLNYDFLSWMASVNGNNFYGYQASGNSAGWLYNSFDLTNVPTLGNLTGQSSVWIAFRFTSNASTVDDGAFLDEIALRKYPTAGPAPTISSITPSSASAGTGSNVTIGGSNLGATQGSSKITFYYQAGEARIEAPIVSWGATSIMATVPVATIGGYPATASSGPAVVTTSGGDSNDYQFAVTFSYIGAKWPGASPDVHYRVNPNTSDVSGEEVAIQAAANTWSTVSGADFQFVDDGATGATQAGYNGTNEVMWRNLGASGTIAANYWWTDGSGNYLEFDQEYNDSYTWSTTGAAGTFDVQNIATHELGHALGLRDLYGDVGAPNDMQKTMYGFGDTAETKNRTLEPDDQAGVIWIYPAAATPGCTLSGPLTVLARDLPEAAPAPEQPPRLIPRLAPEKPADGAAAPETNVVDGAAARPLQALAPPDITNGFEGADFNTNGVTLTPPDPQLAVGPNHVFEMVNITGRIFNKTGVVVDTFPLASFFDVPVGWFDFDPKIIYDDISDRWFASYASTLDNAVGTDYGRLHLAISQTSDPTGAWNVYACQYSDGNFADYPGIGVTDDKLTVSANIFDIDNPSAPFVGEQTIVLQKSDVMAGDPTPGMYQFPYNTNRFTVRPAHSLSSTNDQYLAWYDLLSSTLLDYSRITGTPNAGNVAETAAVKKTVLSQDSPPNSLTSGGGEIDSGDWRALEAIWRDGRLWVSASAVCTPSGDTQTRSCAHLVEINTAGAGTVVNDIMFGASGEYFSWPAVRTDAQGNLHVSLTHTTPSIWAEARVAGRLATDPANTMSGSALLRAGEVLHDSGRWGDYMGAAVDPVGPHHVWVVGQYAKDTGASGPTGNWDWGTYIGVVSFDGTNCQAGVDTDGDASNNDKECYVDTDPLDACPDWTATAGSCPGETCNGDDAWPLDLNVDAQLSVVGDVLNFRDRIGATPGAPNWWQRLDFNGDGQLSVVGDVLMYRNRIGETCA